MIVFMHVDLCTEQHYRSQISLEDRKQWVFGSVCLQRWGSFVIWRKVHVLVVNTVSLENLIACVVDSSVFIFQETESWAFSLWYTSLFFLPRTVPVARLTLYHKCIKVEHVVFGYISTPIFAHVKPCTFSNFFLLFLSSILPTIHSQGKYLGQSVSCKLPDSCISMVALTRLVSKWHVVFQMYGLGVFAHACISCLWNHNAELKSRPCSPRPIPNYLRHRPKPHPLRPRPMPSWENSE